jgi:hypothetical protein
MTAQVQNATFTKDGITITAHTTPDYTEHGAKNNLRKIPSPVTKSNRESDPASVDYSSKNKVKIIDLGISPDNTLTLKGYIITETGTFTDTYGPAMDKKNALKRMFLNGGNIDFTLEIGSVVPGTPFFQKVIVTSWDFVKIPDDAQESINDGIAEYTFTIIMEDANEYGT